MLDRLLNGYLEWGCNSRKRQLVPWARQNIPAHSARIVKHFLSNPALCASTTNHIHLTSCQWIFCFPQRGGKKTPSKHFFFYTCCKSMGGWKTYGLQNKSIYKINLLLLLIGRWPVYSSASLHLFIGRPRFLFPSGIPSCTLLTSRSSAILDMCMLHSVLLLCTHDVMFWIPHVSRILSFLILSILVLFIILLSVFISVLGFVIPWSGIPCGNSNYVLFPVSFFPFLWCWGVLVVRCRRPCPHISRHRVVNQNPGLLTGSLSIHFFFTVDRLLAWSTNPHLWRTGVSLCLAHPLWSVRHGWPYQEHNAPAGLALRVIWARKPSHHVKVEIPEWVFVHKMYYFFHFLAWMLVWIL